MPKKKSLLDDFDALFAEQKTPEQQLKEKKDQTRLNLATNPTYQDSVDFNRQNPGKKSIFPEQKQTYSFTLPQTGEKITTDSESTYLSGLQKAGILKSPEKPKTNKQLYDDRYYGLLLKSKSNKLSSKERAELSKMQSDKGSKKDNEKSYEQLVKEWEKMGDIENTAVETGEIDPNTKQPMTKPFYPESARNIAGSKVDEAEQELKWRDISQETGIPVDQAKTVYEQGKATILPIMQDYKDKKLPYTPEGLKQVLNEKLAQFGIDYEDLLEFDKRLSQ